jgi:hypothetical protein
LFGNGRGGRLSAALVLFWPRGGRQSAAITLFVAAAASALSCSRTQAPFEISLVAASGSTPAFVRVTGISSTDASALRASPAADAAWQNILRVRVEGNDELAVAGAYTVTAGAVEFRPAFPFDPGRRYVAQFDANRLPTPQHVVVNYTFEVPAGPDGARTRVTSIAPTAGVWPENLLRFYIQFSAPMSRTSALGFVRLVDEAGAEVTEAFLPLDVDLWNGDRTRFTVFFDPGRVKRGIRPNVELGRALHAGRNYAIVVDAAWPDAHGRPLAAEFRYAFRAMPALERAVTPADWKIAAPPGGSRDALVVTFPSALDRGLLQRAIGVQPAGGAAVDGVIAIDEGERTWRFTPSVPWRTGAHELVVLSVLEDPAGNRVGRAFEIEMFQKPLASPVERVTVPFTIAGR